MLRILIFSCFIAQVSSACICDGIEIDLTDQTHCFQILRNSGNSWVTADERCASIGGFLAHINSTSLYNQLSDYISDNYEQPIMTGATVANVELDLVALMCPSNTLYSVLSSSFVSSFFEGNPTADDRCTFFSSNTTNKLQYRSCDIDADILCDRPMENTNYCNIKMNCTETTTVSTTTELFTTTSKLTTSSMTPSIMSSSTTSIKPPSTAIASAAPTSLSSQTSSSQTISNSSSSQSSSTTPATTSSQNSVSTSNSTTSLPTTLQVTNVTTTIFTPFTSSGTSRPTPSVPIITPTDPSDSDSCGKGYTRIFGWCVPWWCWLIFGLLLLGLLLCCLAWLCHFCCAGCLCSHQKGAPIERVIERQWTGEDAICQTDPYLIPPGKTVYIPVPKTPPPEREKSPQVIQEQPQPINTHTILHTHEIIREKAVPSIPPPPSVVYDVTVYENAFNTNTVLVPPIVQDPQPTPNLFIPPSHNYAPKITEDDIMSTNSVPIFAEDLTPSPTPLYTIDEADPVPILPVVATQPVVPVLPLKPPKKKKERKPFSPLKHNRPPLGSQVEELPVVRKKALNDDREFPKPPPKNIEALLERTFPEPPPRSPRPKAIPPLVLDETFDRPIRRNTPLNLNEPPERLSRTPKTKERPPVMPRLPMKSPFEVPSPIEEEKVPPKRRRSPPITIFEPVNPQPSPPKPSNQRRMSPMHDEPPRLNTSPRKFRTPSPNDISGMSMMGSSMPPSRRRKSLEEDRSTLSRNDVSIRAPRGRLGGANDKPEGHPGFLDD